MTGVITQLEAATHRVVDHLSAELRELGLTPGEVNALAHLRADVPLSVAELQALTGQRPSTLTGVLDRLERRGLIERAANPSDRRSVLVSLTPEGGAHTKRIARAYEDLEPELRRLLKDVA